MIHHKRLLSYGLHRRLFSCNFSCVVIAIIGVQFFIGDHPRMIHHIWLISYDSSCAITLVWFSICDYFRMEYHTRLFSYRVQLTVESYRVQLTVASFRIQLTVEKYRDSLLSMWLIKVALLEHLISNRIIFLVHVADADNLISTCYWWRQPF